LEAAIATNVEEINKEKLSTNLSGLRTDPLAWGHEEMRIRTTKYSVGAMSPRFYFSVVACDIHACVLHKIVLEKRQPE
jgi:hypothetical protein